MRALVFVVSLGLVVGCHRAPPPEVPETAPTSVVAEELSDDAFAPSVEALLREPRAEVEQPHLAGLIRRQMLHASARFAAGDRVGGHAAVVGALHLAVAGQRAAQVAGVVDDAVSGAASVAAGRGALGEADALYALLEQAGADSPLKSDAAEHRTAIADWLAAPLAPSTVQQLERQHRYSSSVAVLDVRPEATERAIGDAVSWIDEALDHDPVREVIKSPEDHDLAVSAFTAVRYGGLTIIAMQLRHGDAAAALESIRAAQLQRALPPGLLETVDAAAEGSREAWQELVSFFGEATEAADDGGAIDGALARAAAWGSARELYRLDPLDPVARRALVHHALALGMEEVAPLLLVEGFDATELEDASFAMAATHAAILTAHRNGDLAAARRIHRAAEPMLAAVLSSPRRAAVRPHPADVKLLLAALEIRGAEPENARPLLETANEAVPSVDGWRMLGAVHRHAGRKEDARAAYREMGSVATDAGQDALVAESWLATYDLDRLVSDAKTLDALDRALRAALRAQETAASRSAIVDAEQALAHVLERYGATAAVQRAYERAYEAAAADRVELATLLVDAARSALARGDLSFAKRVLGWTKESGLDGDDLLYVALWVRVLERSQGADESDTVDALSGLDKLEGWPERLREWALGRRTTAALVAAARTPAEKTEARFYEATASSPWLVEALTEVAASSALDLVEVGMAQDLVRERGATPTLPADVRLP